MRIFLVGFMGSGKTEVGRLVARELGYPFLDLDAEIAAEAGMTIPELFLAEGEAAFRARESAALRTRTFAPDLVVSTGGGAMVSEENRRFLRERGTTVWLNPSFETLCRRLGPEARAKRPLFRDEGAALDLWRARFSLYETADLEISVAEHETAEETARRVLRGLAG